MQVGQLHAINRRSMGISTPCMRLAGVLDEPVAQPRHLIAPEAYVYTHACIYQHLPRFHALMHQRHCIQYSTAQLLIKSAASVTPAKAVLIP